MRSSSTFSILFWVYAKRSKNNQAPLYARITVDRKKLNISLKRRIDTRLWNAQKQRIKGNSQTARDINQYLDDVYSNLFQCYQELRAEDKRITPQAIKSKFLKDDKAGHFTLRDIIAHCNKTMFHKLHHNITRLYLTSQKYIMLFVRMEYKREDMELTELDYPFILRFENFLRRHKPRHYQQQIGNNAVMKHIQRLRKMITLAYHMEWIEKDPFLKFRQKLIPTHREFLTPLELERIEALNIDSVRLNTVRDLFVFSCYTGISYTDLMSLTKESLVLALKMQGLTTKEICQCLNINSNNCWVLVSKSRRKLKEYMATQVIQ
jgi:hypothetical protein